MHLHRCQFMSLGFAVVLCHIPAWKCRTFTAEGNLLFSTARNGKAHVSFLPVRLSASRAFTAGIVRASGTIHTAVSNQIPVNPNLISCISYGSDIPHLSVSVEQRRSPSLGGTRIVPSAETDQQTVFLLRLPAQSRFCSLYLLYPFV